MNWLASAWSQQLSWKILICTRCRGELDSHKYPDGKYCMWLLLYIDSHFHFGWLLSLWFTCLMLSLIKESVYTAVLCYCSLVRIRQSLLFSLVMCGRHELKHVVTYRSMHLTQTDTRKAFKLLASSLRFTNFSPNIPHVLFWR